MFGAQIGEASAQLAQFLVLVNAVVNSLEVSGVKFDVGKGKWIYEKNGFKIEGVNIAATGNISYNPNGEHIAAVEIFLLRNLGYQSAELNLAAQYALSRDRDNPFFEYLAHSRSSRLLDLMVAKCPARERPSRKRFQWFPERGEEAQPGGEKAWEESMYWDCVFLSRVYEAEISSRLTRASSDDLFGALSNAAATARARSF